jgi:hypothetical protein
MQKLILIQLNKQFFAFMKSEHSVQCASKIVKRFHPEPNKSSPHAHIPGQTRYPLYRRLGGPQGWSGQVQQIWPSPGFDPRTVQPVASRYTAYTTRPLGLIKSGRNSVETWILTHALYRHIRLCLCLPYLWQHWSKLHATNNLKWRCIVKVTHKSGSTKCAYAEYLWL